VAALAFPQIDPVAFSIGPLAVRWYGLAYLAGFLFAWYMLRVLDERWKMGLGPDGRATTVLAAVIGVVVGGRLGYVLFYGAGQYWRAPLTVFAIWDGGMSFHGGLVGILLCGWWVARRYRVPFLRLADAGAVAAPFGIMLGRIANFINDELWGRVTTVPWAVIFPGAGPLPRHPSQLYEAALEGLVLLIVMLLLARRRRSDGFMLGWVLTLYGTFRIFVEFFRQPDVQIGFLRGGVTMGQVLSVPVLVCWVLLLWYVARHPTDQRHDASVVSGAPAGSAVAPDDLATVAGAGPEDRTARGL
jgi:phosphatidylglycerol:prolipoprotein diacylglycerol transferase